jgi:hypothetical protein
VQRRYVPLSYSTVFTQHRESRLLRFNIHLRPHGNLIKAPASCISFVLTIGSIPSIFTEFGIVYLISGASTRQDKSLGDGLGVRKELAFTFASFFTCSLSWCRHVVYETFMGDLGRLMDMGRHLFSFTLHIFDSNLYLLFYPCALISVTPIFNPNHPATPQSSPSGTPLQPGSPHS